MLFLEYKRWPFRADCTYTIVGPTSKVEWRFHATILYNKGIINITLVPRKV